jgi:hypothetical protein
MNVKALPLLLCVFLLCECSKEMPEGETCLPVSETQAFTEVLEKPTIPESWKFPKEAVSCQIALMPGSDSYVFYDEHGNEILMCYPDSNEPEISAKNTIWTHYTYNDDGTYLYRSTQGMEKTKERYVYNDDHTVKQCYTYQDGREDGYIGYTYDKHGQPTSEYYVRLDDRVCMYEIKYKNTYDDEGRLICKKTKGFDIMAMDRFYEYDDDGNVIHETMWSPYLQEIVSESRYTYDDQGRKIAEESYSGDGGITMGIRYAYVDLT